MNKIVSLDKARKSARKQAGKANTLCKQGHHKWQVVKDSEFDSKQGKLVTVMQCSRCGKRKIKGI